MRDSLGALASISFIGKIIGRVADYALFAVVALFLGASKLGLISISIVVMGFVTIFSTIGLDVMSQRSPDVHGKLESNIFTVHVLSPIVIGLLFSTSVFILLPDQVIDGPSRIFVFLSPVLASAYALEGLAKGRKDIESAVIIRDLSVSLITLVLTTILLYFGGGILSVFVAYMTASLLSIVISVHRLDISDFRILVPDLTNSVSTGISGIQMSLEKMSYSIISWVDILILGFFVSDSLVGQYQIYYRTSVLLSFVLVSVNSIFPSFAAELYADGKIELLQTTYQNVSKWVGMTTLLSGLYLVLYSETLVSLLGENFSAGVPGFNLLVAAQVITAFVGPTGYLLLMTGKERSQMLFTIVTALINVILNLLLVPTYGILGAAISTAVSLSVLAVLQVSMMYHEHGLFPISKEHAKLIPALVLSSLILLISHRMVPDTTATALISGTTSFSTFVLLGYLSRTKSDLKLVQAIR